MNQTILLFEIQNQKKETLQEICDRLTIKTVEITPQDYLQKLGYLAGIQGFTRQRAAYTGAALPDEMMVFSGMDSDHLDVFLNAYKGKGLAPIGLKAALTPHNILWTPRDLFRHLQEEHRNFSKLL